MRTAIFTIISPNYRSHARVLMASAQENHPEWDRFVLLVGESAADPPDEPSFTTLPLESLALPHPRRFAFRYTLLELNTAVKPWVFESLFSHGYDRVVYLDPDTFIYSPLEELDSASPAPFLTLTPHLTNFKEGHPAPAERMILLAGAYNLGFLAVLRHPALSRFLRWWQEKLELECIVDPPRGFFVDQRWMDLAPGLFPDVAILRHEGYNTAYWNLEHRQVRFVDGRATVNDQPLRFFHFSGFDPAFPGLVSKHYVALSIDRVGEARRLFEGYGTALLAAGYASFKDAPYSYGTFDDGTRVPNIARVTYRDSGTLQSACGEDPFAHAELFRNLDDADPEPIAAKLRVRSYAVLSRARPLVALIPRGVRSAMRDLLLIGRRRAAPDRALHDTTSLPPGLNVVGYITRDTGVGESARLCAKSSESAGLPTQRIDVDSSDAFSRQAVYRATIYHVNADQILAVRDQIPYLFNSSSYNIGCWHWELPELPDAWVSSAEPLHEIWAPSAFIQSAVSRKVTIPVVHMPHGIEVTEIEECSPEELGVPPGHFTFLCMFDLDSVMTRKNPYGAVEAFRRAFRGQSAAALLVKVTNADSHPEERAELEERLRGIPNVYWTDRKLSRARVNGLLAASDGVVSLHRSEGFGLILAEAMDLGKPVVATGWSGNVDFMNHGNSCPVDYELVTLDHPYSPYQAGQQWAEPDVDHAAYFMRRLVEDTPYRTRISERGRETIRSNFSPRAAGLRYRQRLTFLGLMNVPLAR